MYIRNNKILKIAYLNIRRNYTIHKKMQDRISYKSFNCYSKLFFNNYKTDIDGYKFNI